MTHLSSSSCGELFHEANKDSVPKDQVQVSDALANHLRGAWQLGEGTLLDNGCCFCGMITPPWLISKDPWLNNHLTKFLNVLKSAQRSCWEVALASFRKVVTGTGPRF